MNERQKIFLHQAALALAVGSGLFLLLCCGLLAYNEARGKVTTLVKSKEVVQLHDDLRRQPTNEQLMQRIRQLDLQLRQNTFYQLQLSHNATRAAIGGLVVFLASFHLARTLQQQSPNPIAWGARKAGEEKRIAMIGLIAVASMFAILAVTALAVSTQSVQLPQRTANAPQITAAPDFASAAEMLMNWPSFRGANGLGVAPQAVVSLPWTVRWKTPIPLHGMSSPIIWENFVFLTGATENENRVFCFDSESGQLKWSSQTKLPGGSHPAAPKVDSETSLAAPTAVTDGRRVYAIFPNGEIAAFDFNGKQIWDRNVGPLENAYGYAASLAIYQDRVLIQIDRGQAEDGQSKVIGLDARTGQERWQNKRDVAGSWSSPVVFEINGQPQLITCANPFVIAYNPIDGHEIWRSDCLESDVAPSPIFAQNMIVAIAPNNFIVGLRPGEKQIAWKADEGVPDACSPVCDGQRVYILSSGGLITCCNLQTGKVIWTHELDDHFYASPTLAGNTLIFLSRKGNAYLLATGDEYKELGKAAIGEAVNASPALMGKRLYIRGKTKLICIECQ